MIVLKHLWSLPSHREAFRGIAQLSSSTSSSNSSSATAAADTEAPTAVTNDYFIRFANGLMNETNALVTTTMEKLSEIRKAQGIMADRAGTGEWAAMNAETQQQFRERLEQHESEVKGTAGLCLETLNMMFYLTSDEVIRGPFLSDEILPRFASMLLSVLSKLVGTRSLDIKVDNSESYHFDPKTMLRYLCGAILNFAEDATQGFVTALAKDGFFGDGNVVGKAITTVSKLGLLPPGEIATLQNMYEAALRVHAMTQNLEELLGDAPDEFLDPLLQTLMRDPVRLPTSGHIVDRATIAQHLLNDEKDPFNRQPLKIGDVVAETDLKRRIEEWIQSKLNNNGTAST